MSALDLDAAARRAFDADCAARSEEPSDAAFAADAAKWRGIAAAAIGTGDPTHLHESASRYAHGVFELHGIDGLNREVARLIRKLETAAGHQYAGSTLDLMAGTDAYRHRAEVQYGRGDATSLALELDGLQSRVVQIQRQIDPHTKAALIMHVDEDKWERYDSYQAFLDAYDPARHAA